MEGWRGWPQSGKSRRPPQEVTFKLRPGGIRHMGGWGKHCCLGQECVLEVTRRPVWLEGYRSLGGRGWGRRRSRGRWI